MKKKINTYTGCYLLIVIILILGVIMKINPKMLIASELASLFLYSKLVLAFTVNKGHGVLQLDKFKLRGFNVKHLLVLSIISFLLLYFLYKSFFSPLPFHVSSIQNFRHLSLSLWFSFCTALFVWNFYWYYETYSLSMYDMLLYKHTSLSEQK